MTPDDRARFLALMPGLAPDADARAVHAFLQAHREACLEELGALPGHDQVRTGVLRALELLEPDPARRLDHHARVAASLEAFDPPNLSRVDGMRRHPAWVALCRLELAHARDERLDDALPDAIRHARAGFAVLSPLEPQGAGEVLWALAEAASDVGWTDHADVLLTASVGESFSDPENLGRVKLLIVLRRLDQDDPRTAATVDALLQDEDLDTQTRVHALWIGAHLDRDQGRLARALTRLEEASQRVDQTEDPEVAARIVEALQAWSGAASGPAEA